MRLGERASWAAFAVLALGCSANAGFKDREQFQAMTGGSSQGSGGTPGSGGASSGGSSPGIGGLMIAIDGGVDQDAGLPKTCGSNLTGTLRDFHDTHPDFEHLDTLGKCFCSDLEIVTTELGPDDKPIYAGDPTTGTMSTTGKANFDQWFTDVDGVNTSIPYTLEFVAGANGIYTFEDLTFFPIDNQLFMNEGRFSNFHFTFELHTTFLYNGGEIFNFRGDDDVFTYINNKRVVNLGGIHDAQEANIDLDAMAAELGLTVGGVYKLDFFFAERHCCASTFRIDTTLAFVSCGVPQ